MRIVGGARRGTAITSPAGLATRPTTDRVRESLFNIMMHRYGDHVVGARVLDLFAGSGALGLEALSRGAAFALFVDDASAARAAIRRNVDAMGALGMTRIWRRSAVVLGDCPVPPFDTVFLDPPYGQALGEQALGAARRGGWLVAGALAVLEEDASHTPSEIDGFVPVDQRRMGRTALSFWRASGDGATG